MDLVALKLLTVTWARCAGFSLQHFKYKQQLCTENQTWHFRKQMSEWKKTRRSNKMRDRYINEKKETNKYDILINLFCSFQSYHTNLISRRSLLRCYETVDETFYPCWLKHFAWKFVLYLRNSRLTEKSQYEQSPSA